MCSSFWCTKKSKLVPGTVLEVEIDRSGKRANCFITIEFDIGNGAKKVKRLNIRSVKPGDPPQNGSNPPVPARDETSAEIVQHPPSRDLLPQPTTGAYSTEEGQQTDFGADTNGKIVVHGTLWEQPSNGEDEITTGPHVHARTFGIRTVTGEVIMADCDYSERAPIDYFLMMFPPKQIQAMVTLTNAELAKLSLPTTQAGELFKFMGVLMLCTRYEFGERRSLWSKEPPSKYQPAPNFGKTGMSRSRFDFLFRCVRFSYQPEERGTMTSEQYRWSLVDDFVNRFNEHRASNVLPSERICVDESISRWYGQGGDWINHGLPMYVAIDRKPENGCEIQNSACGRSGVMLRLRLVRTAEEDHAHLNETDSGLLHGTQVLKDLVSPWAQTSRIVCADSYFASVTSALELEKMGLRFIGVIKTATRQYPMQALSNIELSERGQKGALVHKRCDRIALIAILWVDRDRRYFISSTSSSKPGTHYVRFRWRQLSTEPGAQPERVKLTIPQPEAVEFYYSACAKIDQHNRCRQKDLQLERKIGTLDWSMRVNLSLVGMCVVDSWLAFKACKGSRCMVDQRDFYNKLTEQLIDNNFDYVGCRERQDVGNESAAVVDGNVRSGIDVHLTPTKKRRTCKGQRTQYLLQGKCLVCGTKTTKECSFCRDRHVRSWLCDTKKGKRCFPTHLKHSHDI